MLGTPCVQVIGGPHQGAQSRIESFGPGAAVQLVVGHEIAGAHLLEKRQ